MLTLFTLVAQAVWGDTSALSAAGIQTLLVRLGVCIWNCWWECACVAGDVLEREGLTEFEWLVAQFEADELAISFRF